MFSAAYQPTPSAEVNYQLDEKTNSRVLVKIGRLPVTYVTDQKESIRVKLTLGSHGMIQHRLEIEAEACKLLKWAKKTSRWIFA